MPLANSETKIRFLAPEERNVYRNEKAINPQAPEEITEKVVAGPWSVYGLTAHGKESQRCSKLTIRQN
jgi:hypothetical protein